MAESSRLAAHPHRNAEPEIAQICLIIGQAWTASGASLRSAAANPYRLDPTGRSSGPGACRFRQNRNDPLEEAGCASDCPGGRPAGHRSAFAIRTVSAMNTIASFGLRPSCNSAMPVKRSWSGPMGSARRNYTQCNAQCGMGPSIYGTFCGRGVGAGARRANFGSL